MTKKAKYIAIHEDPVNLLRPTAAIHDVRQLEAVERVAGTAKHRAWRRGKRLRGSATEYQLFGPTCDPVDRFARPVQLPAGLQEGDYIEFGLLGAYGSATATRFNGFDSSNYFDVLEGTDFS